MSQAVQYMPGWLLNMAQRRERWWLYVVGAVLIFFLFTHQRQDTVCNHNVTIYGVIELQMGCDTNSINNLSHDPAKIFTEYHNWTSRPVYLAYGVLAGQAVLPMVQPVWKILVKPWTHMKAYMKNFNKNFHMHFVLIALNIFVVFYAVKLGLRLSEVPISSLSAVSLAAAITSFELVQGSVFMFHTNLFNMLTAIGAAAYVSLGMSARFQSLGQVALYGLLIGCGILTYPSIAILAPAYIVGTLYGRWRWPDQSPDWSGIFLRIVTLVLSAAILPVLWNVLHEHVFENHVYLTAVDGRQFVWLLEAYREGVFLETLSAKWNEFSALLFVTLGYEFLMAIAAMGALAVLGGRTFWRELSAPIVVCLVIATLGVLSFNFLQGYYAYRLQACVLLLVYILIARMAHVIERPSVGAGMLLVISAYQLVDATLETARV